MYTCKTLLAQLTAFQSWTYSHESSIGMEAIAVFAQFHAPGISFSWRLRS